MEVKMIYSEETLGKILRNMYDNAPHNEQMTMIFLFGIKYGCIIEQNNFKIADIVYKSGINQNFKTEVRRGLKLGKYVEIKSDMDTF